MNRDDVIRMARESGMLIPSFRTCPCSNHQSHRRAAMTPAETTAFLRRYNAWRRGEDETQPMPDPREIGLAIDAAVEMIERLAALPARITPEQAPVGVSDYCHEAADGYADGWNDCIKAIKEESK